MRPKTWLFPIAIALVAQAAYIARADEDDDDDEAQVGDKDLKDAKVKLEDALKTTEAQGTPISAKYELEKGKLQLSVYTMKGDKFSEVIVDHKTGKVAKTEAITSGEDLAAAKKQAAAMAKTKRSDRKSVV